MYSSLMVLPSVHENLVATSDQLVMYGVMPGCQHMCAVMLTRYMINNRFLESGTM